MFVLVHVSPTVLLGVGIVDSKTDGTNVIIIVEDIDGNLVKPSIVVAEYDG